MMAHLRPAGKARLHLESANVERNFFTELADEHGTLGTRPHHAHVTLQHAQNLRQFVDTGLAQELAYLRDTRIVLSRPLGTELLGIGPHGTELVHRERLAVKSNAFLGIEHRATVLQLDGDGRENPQRERHQADKPAHDQIHDALHAHLPRGHGEREKFLQFKTVNEVRLEPSVHHGVKFRNYIDVQRHLANPHEHAHNLLRRRTFVRNDNPGHAILFHESGQVRIFTKHGETGELTIHHLEALVHKPDNALTSFRRILQVFGNLAARLGSAEHQDIVRPVAKPQ